MKKFLLTLCGVVFLSSSVASKELVGIAAIVNDSVISILDVIARTKMTALASGLQDSPELRAQLVQPVLQNLIEEKLQVQEAERRGLSVTDEEILSAFASVENQNGIMPGQLEKWLTSIGLPMVIFEDQIRAQLLWGKVLATGLRPQVNVKEEEVEQELARLQADRGKPEYLVSQIDFYPGPTRSVDALFAIAEELVAQIRGGADFGALAAQFSDSALAGLGGDMGWLSSAQVLPELRNILSEMSLGEISAPIQSVSGIHIIQLRDRRQIMVADSGEIRVNLVQIILPQIPAGADAAEQETLIGKISDNIRGCEEMAAMAERLDPNNSGSLGWVSLKDLPEQFRGPLSELPIGIPSKLLLWREGIHVMMVCDRQNPAEAIDHAWEIRDRMERTKLETLSRRLLRDLRRSALVDIRV